MSNSYNVFGRNFWMNIENLGESDKRQFPIIGISDIPREEIIARIEDIIVDVVHQISSGVVPQLKLRDRRSWGNCNYVPNVGVQLAENGACTTVSLAKETSVEKFGLILKVMAKIYNLLQSRKTTTKRNMFYEEPQLFRSQTVLDQIVDDIACMLDVPRRNLHVVATSKGCVVGDLKFTDADGSIVNSEQDISVMHMIDEKIQPLKKSIMMVPLQVDKIENICTEKARFVLVVEKDATFQRLLDDGFVENMPCIMITGKGIPDVNTRLMIRKIWNSLKIPVFGLMDADPHGIEIFCVYKFGSLSQSFDASSLVLPFMHWLGVFPSDIVRLSLPEDVVLPFTPNDEAKCRDLLSRPYIQHFPRLKEEMHQMSQTKRKAEIQALTRISLRYLSQMFIPRKIKHGDWI